MNNIEYEDLSIEDMEPEAEPEPAEGRALIYVHVDQLTPHPDNPRKDLGDLSEMAESIKANGILQNLTVVPHIESTEAYEQLLDGTEYSAAYRNHAIKYAFKGGYDVIIGHRRLAAAKLAGLSHLPCVVTDMDYRAQRATMLTENLQRADLTPYEQATEFRQLTMDLGMSVSAISEQTGFSETTVRRRLKLGALDGEVLRKETAKAAERGRQLSMADLEAVAEIEDERKRTEVLREIGTDNFNIKLKGAMSAQEREQKIRAWKELFEARGLEEIPQSKMWGTNWKPIHQFLVEARAPSAEEVDKLTASVKDGERWGFAYYYGWIYIKQWRDETTAEPAPAVREYDPDDAERTEEPTETAAASVESVPEPPSGPSEEKLRRVSCTLLEQAFANAYDLRRTFFDGMSELVAGRCVQTMVEMMLDLIENNNCCLEMSEEEVEIIRRRLDHKKPMAALLTLLYFQLWDSKRTCCNDTYGPSAGQFNEEDDDRAMLEKLYAGLTSMGYRMSDEERALLDGSHRYYYHEGWTPPEDEEKIEGEAETVEEHVKTRFEVYQGMSDEELEEELSDWDNYTKEFQYQIKFQETPEDVARSTHDWFCSPHEENERCQAAENSCERCIAAWLNEPYKKEN